MNEEDDKCLDVHCWRNKSRLYRYFALIHICFLGLGAFAIFDSVGAYQEALMDRFQLSFSEFSLMYSVSAWANIVLSSFGGVLIDRVFGVKKATLLYGSIIIIGHAIFSLGVLLTTFWCALLGRFIAGVGTEFMYICLQVHSIQYFKGKELSMVMCINISVARLGTSVVYAIAEPVLNGVKLSGKEDVGIAEFIVGTFSLLPLISGAILAYMSPKQNDSSETKDTKKIEMKTKWKDNVTFPLEYWLILIIQASFVAMFYTFLPFSQEFFKTMYGMTVEAANNLTSLFTIAGAVVSPFVGIIIDKTGRGLTVAKIGFIIALISHLILGFSNWTPYFSLFILAVSYAIFSGSIVPMIAFIVPDHKLGSAYGICQSSINLTYAVFIYVAGVIVDAYSYTGLEVFILLFVVVCLITAVLLRIKDARGSGILNMTPSQRNLYLAKELESNDIKKPLNC